MVEKNLDFRSDTTTWPSPEMREAAATAAVGDMGYGEDPTVNELESLAAEVFGKEAGLFCTSGTQGNAISVLSHTQRGDEFVLGSGSHIFRLERGHWSVIGSLVPKLVNEEKGWLRPEDVEAAISKRTGGPKTSLLCMENTHLSSGGTPISAQQFKASYDVAKSYGLGVHVDGARIFNAATALGVDAKDIAVYTDTVQACLSKGLAAPVGSVVVGSNELIENAKQNRRLLGGSMRQAGIIAAPGIVALTSMVGRLGDDHENARILADGLEALGIGLRFPVKTNMLFINYSGIGWNGEDWTEVCTKLGWKTRGGPTGTRLCLHYGIEKEDIKAFLEGLTPLIP
jgi:threonine aldolase